MRFVLAIAAFVVAAIMIGAGIAQRTIWEPPDHITAQTTLKGDAPFAVISGNVLTANPNQQALTISGSQHIFVAYGRTADVMGWLKGEKYSKVGYNQKTDTLTSKLVEPSKQSSGTDGSGQPAPTGAPAPSASATPAPAGAQAASAPDPDGSDLWLQQYTGTSRLFLRESLPKNVSMIVAADGTAPAPADITISWPVNSTQPWSGPLIVGGGVLLLIGLCLYLWALLVMRKSRGPRRKGLKPPRAPKPPRYKPSRQKAITSSSHGRRAAGRGMLVVPAVLVGTLVFTGCSSDYWPSFGQSTPTPAASPVLKAAPAGSGDMEPPAVTVPQLKQIVARISDVAAKADAAGDADLAATRFTGPALELRQANYTIRAKKKDEAPPAAIPSDPLSLVLPQATKEWPRIVETVVQDKTDPKVAPQLLVLRQENPHENYHVSYAIELEPNVRVPDLAPANVGTSLVQPDTKLLRVAPDDLVKAYSDILAKGKDSTYYPLFDADSDKLRSQIGEAYRAKTKKDLPKTAKITFTDSAGTGVPIAMATNDSGALVTVTLDETETVKPVEEGAQVKPEGAVKALSGVDATKKGIASTYSHQLLFYVPPANTQLQVRLLGYTLALIKSSELK